MALALKILRIFKKKKKEQWALGTAITLSSWVSLVKNRQEEYRNILHLKIEKILHHCTFTSFFASPFINSFCSLHLLPHSQCSIHHGQL